MRGLAKFIMRGRGYAVFIAALFGVVSNIWQLLPLALLSAAALGLVNLRKGWVEVVNVGLYAGILIIIAFLLMPTYAGIKFPLVFVVWAVVLAGTSALRVFQSQAAALIAVGVVCVLFVIGMHLVVGDVVEWWVQWRQAFISNLLGSDFDDYGADGISRVYNGFAAMIMCLTGMMSVLMARWMQSFLYNPGGYKTEFNSLMLPKMMLPVVIGVLLVAGTIKNGLMVDLFMVAVAVFFYQGLATLHGMGVKNRWSKIWIWIPYILLFSIPQICILGFAALGAIDSTFDFRSVRGQ